MSTDFVNKRTHKSTETFSLRGTIGDGVYEQFMAAKQLGIPVGAYFRHTTRLQQTIISKLLLTYPADVQTNMNTCAEMISNARLIHREDFPMNEEITLLLLRMGQVQMKNFVATLDEVQTLILVHLARTKVSTTE
jgi:hypothetical protein